MSADNNPQNTQELLKLAEAELSASNDASIDWVTMIFLGCVVLMSVFSLVAIVCYFPYSLVVPESQEDDTNARR